METAYYLDLDIIYHTLTNNLWYLIRILAMTYVAFYYLPSKIFPQEHTGEGIQKIIFNFVYMTAYVEIVLTFLIFIKVFSIIIFIISLILTRLLVLKYYYNKQIVVIMEELRMKSMHFFLHILDNPHEVKENFRDWLNNASHHIQEHVNIYTFARTVLFVLVFFYIIAILMARGMLSYGDPSSDTAQFIEWVGMLEQNTLFSDSKSFGADFYGQAIIIFFIALITNINKIVIFSLFPVLILLALYLSIYYVVKQFTNSKYSGLFAVMIHGLVLMSPLSEPILGKIFTTSLPDLVHIFNFSFYVPNAEDVKSGGNYIGTEPYLRYIAGLAYEISSVFVLLNMYFLIRALDTKLNRYIWMYGLTLLLVFTFHGGGAIFLLPASILISLNALVFRKINVKLLKKGLIAVLLAAVIGNLWMLAMIKYGIPEDFGAAAPFIDKILQTKNQTKNIVNLGYNSVSIVQITTLHLIMMGLLAFSFIVAMFSKKRFEYTSVLLFSLAIFITYFGPNAGIQLLAHQARQAEYLFMALTMIAAFYFFAFFYKPMFLLFKKHARYPIFGASLLIFLVAIAVFPKWINNYQFWKNISMIEYSSIPQTILKINDDNRPFTWTIVGYVQSYPKVLNIGYHINIQQFLLDYSPTKQYLEVPTEKVYIFVDNVPTPYMGLHQWYYRWRDDIQNNIKTWITMYGATHNNMKVYTKTSTITVYEIDNHEYMEKLAKEEMKKNDDF